MGVDFISFNLERGSSRKLEASMIWNLANWLEGLGYILETNPESMEEVQAIQESVSYQYISLPLESWNPQQSEPYKSLILRGSGDHDPNFLIDTINRAQSQEREIKLELSFSELDQVDSMRDISEHLFFNFTEVSVLQEFLSTVPVRPFGLSLGTEVEEATGLLNFDLLDSLLEKLGKGNERDIEMG